MRLLTKWKYVVTRSVLTGWLCLFIPAVGPPCHPWEKRFFPTDSRAVPRMNTDFSTAHLPLSRLSNGAAQLLRILVPHAHVRTCFPYVTVSEIRQC